MPYYPYPLFYVIVLQSKIFFFGINYLMSKLALIRHKHLYKHLAQIQKASCTITTSICLKSIPLYYSLSTLQLKDWLCLQTSAKKQPYLTQSCAGMACNLRIINKKPCFTAGFLVCCRVFVSINASTWHGRCPNNSG